MTALANSLIIIVFPYKVRQIRVRCGWTYNRTVFFDDRNILFEVTKCCDLCKHCLSREQVVERALLGHGAQYEFATDARTLTRWVTITRPDDRDPVDYLKQVTDLPIRRVYFERRTARKCLDWLATGFLILAAVYVVCYALWQLGTSLLTYLSQ